MKNETVTRLEGLVEKSGQAIALVDLIRNAPADQLAPDTLMLAGSALDDILRDVDVGIGGLLETAKRGELRAA